MNLSQIGSQISQAQLNQIVNTFGADPAFQTFLSTGTLPTNSPVPSSTSITSPNSPGGTPIPGVAQAAAAAAAGIPLPAAPAYTGSTPAPAPTTASATAPATSATPISVPGNPGNTPVAPAPVVNGTGLAPTTFTSLVSAPTASAFFAQLSSLNLSQVGSQISQAQVNQIVSQFSSDPLFQTFLSTGQIPTTATTQATSTSSSKVPVPSISTPAPAPIASGGATATTPVTTPVVATPPAPSASPSTTPVVNSGSVATASNVAPIVVPTVSGSGLDTASFNNLANAPTASAFLSQLSTQNLGAVASSISQTQLNQLVSKFGSDPNFQTLLATGTIPTAVITPTSKAMLSSSQSHQDVSVVQHIELNLIGQHSI
jgi:uncharacterized protein YneF (UPF0154 family)